jgi:hypothetical protein
MTISDASEANILKLVFQAVNWANVADNAASGALGTINWALHTADPGDNGTMATSEASTYTGYTRVTNARSTSGFSVSGTAPCEAKPLAAISFPTSAGGGSPTVTFFSTGKSGAAGAATEIFWSGGVSPSVAVSSGVTPQLSTATSIQLD